MSLFFFFLNKNLSTVVSNPTTCYISITLLSFKLYAILLKHDLYFLQLYTKMHLVKAATTSMNDKGEKYAVLDKLSK